MAAVSQTAFNRFYFTFIDHITMYIGYTGNAGENTGAIRITQTTFDSQFLTDFRVDKVMTTEFFAKITQLLFG